jgi:NADPH:quinone reductase-like Zn-dependent oxidoreductase
LASNVHAGGVSAEEANMKAVVINATGGPEQLTLADMSDPVPGLGELLLDVAYAGCNWADTQVRQGIYPHAMTYPMVLGFEVSGTVAALGAGVSGVQRRDRVAAFPRRAAPTPRNAWRPPPPDQAAGQRAARCRRGLSDPGPHRLARCLPDAVSVWSSTLSSIAWRPMTLRSARHGR